MRHLTCFCDSEFTLCNGQRLSAGARVPEDPSCGPSALCKVHSWDRKPMLVLLGLRELNSRTQLASRCSLLTFSTSTGGIQIQGGLGCNLAQSGVGRSGCLEAFSLQPPCSMPSSLGTGVLDRWPGFHCVLCSEIPMLCYLLVLTPISSVCLLGVPLETPPGFSITMLWCSVLWEVIMVPAAWVPHPVTVFYCPVPCQMQHLCSSLLGFGGTLTLSHAALNHPAWVAWGV
jgi:hypothetical protein